MRTMRWVGGVSLAALLVFGGCSDDDEPQGGTGAGGSADAGTGGKLDAGTGGVRLEAGVGGGTVNAGGTSVDAGDAGIGGFSGAQLDGATAAGGSDAGRGSSGDASATGGNATGGNATGGNANEAGVPADARPDNTQPDAKVEDGATFQDATVDVNPVGVDVAAVPSDAATDGGAGACRLSATGAGQCEATVLFPTRTETIESVTISSCPNGANPSTGVCVGQGSFGNAGWTVTGPSTVQGTVGLRAPNIEATVQMTVLRQPVTINCNLAIGGASYAQVPVEITLPQGTPASGFIPGCTPVSAPQVRLRSSVPYQVSGDGLCATAADVLVTQVGGMDVFNENLENLVAEALTQRVCLR